MRDIEQVTGWLESHLHHSLRITKQEDGDIDRIQLHLNRVSIGHLQQKDPEGYVAKDAVLLHGEGTIQSDQGQAHVPLNVYEIPWTEQVQLKKDDQHMVIETERATYTLENM